MPRDLIITCFARPGSKQLRDAGVGFMSPSDAFPVGQLKRAYDTFSIEKAQAGHVANAQGQYCDQGDVWGGFCFDKIAEKYRAAGGGSVLRGAILANGKNPADYEGGRIAVIGFSAGCGMVRSLIKDPADAEKVDTLITLDGLTFPKSGSNIIDDPAWMSFARRASGIDRIGTTPNPYLGPMMLNLNTSIVSPAPTLVSSTSDARRRIFSVLSDPYMARLGQVPKAFVDQLGLFQQYTIRSMREALARLPVPFKIGSASACPPGKTYDAKEREPWSVGYLGNLWNLEWPGKTGSDHCFVSIVGLMVAVDAFLAKRWNSDVPLATAGLGTLGAGVDALPGASVTYQSPDTHDRGGAVLNPGALGPAHYSPATIAVAGLAGVLGYYLGQKLWEKI